jgi:hypothetical protein
MTSLTTTPDVAHPGMLDLRVGDDEADAGVGAGWSVPASGRWPREPPRWRAPGGATSTQRMVGLIGASSRFSKPRVST